MKTPTISTLVRLNTLGRKLGNYRDAINPFHWLVKRTSENTVQFQHIYTGLTVNLWHDMPVNVNGFDLNGFDDQIEE